MKIKFSPLGKEVEAKEGQSLLQIAHENQIVIRSICKGVPSCSECRIKIISGENNISQPTKAELNLIGTSYYLDGRRLACQCRCFGTVEVDVSEHIQQEGAQSKKIRGFRSKNATETVAIQDTMILTESGKKLN